MIKVQFAGRLTAVPEQKVTQNGKELCTFSVAVRRRYGKDEQGRPLSDFPNCVAYGQLSAFICRYFGKGDWIDISGVLQSRKYTDKDGNNRTFWEVTVDSAEFCGGKSENKGMEQSTVSSIPQDTQMFLDDDADLPF